MKAMDLFSVEKSYIRLADKKQMSEADLKQSMYNFIYIRDHSTDKVLKSLAKEELRMLESFIPKILV